MNNNPFVLPGFGQSGPQGQNPILASMEMMRQAWQGLAAPGGMDAAAMGRLMSIEEMDKRIADLRAVENWLRMNLSMLSSTIQGLEVQRATISTLKSFVDTGMASMAQVAAGAESAAAEAARFRGQGDNPGASAADGSRPRAASPLEEVLGLRPGVGQADAAEQAQAPQGGVPGGQGGAAEAAQPAGQSEAGAAPDAQSDIVGAAASAAQGWWNLLQQQFQTLAAATAASAEGAFSELKDTGKSPARAAKKTAAGGTAAKTARKAAAPAAKKAGAKSAARTAAKRAGKTAARKAGAARKTTG
ncbi:transcriptional regulator [Alcaligenaceae bacterium]|nr:transcriptional regulator [Alcaligenaceae bacterium]